MQNLLSLPRKLARKERRLRDEQGKPNLYDGQNNNRARVGIGNFDISIVFISAGEARDLRMPAAAGSALTVKKGGFLNALFHVSSYIPETKQKPRTRLKVVFLLGLKKLLSKNLRNRLSRILGIAPRSCKNYRKLQKKNSSNYTKILHVI